jgi:hypothetical protein
MTPQEIKALFPLKANITEEIINTATLLDTSRCIGAKTLQSVLPKELKVDWGVYYGDIIVDDEQRIQITTTEQINMMSIKLPQSVTFIIP